MYDLFCNKYPDLTNTVKYEYYLQHYNENFGYKFKRPQVDVCSVCEELETKKNQIRGITMENMSLLLKK